MGQNDSFTVRLKRDLKRHYWKYLLMLPILAYFIIFAYKPMYGLIIAFKKYKPTLGISRSKWVGIKYFVDFFNDVYFFRVLKNTIIISLYSILFGFTSPIILALLLNELRHTGFKRVVQTVTYIPHFISLVVVCGILRRFASSTGVFNDIIAMFGGTRVSMLTKASYFRPLYIISDIWQEVGWGSIIYLAALTSIDPQLYEAAEIDGAGRMRQTWHITLPGLMPTIIMLLILRMGSILGVGYEKILLLYNEATYETADVISTYVYRKGLLDANFSYSTAVGLFNSVINVIFLVGANVLGKKVANVGLF